MMKPYFILTTTTIIDRKVIKEKRNLDITTNRDSYRKYLTRISKSEKIIIQLELVSSGKTKHISNDKIIYHVMSHLDGAIK